MRISPLISLVDEYAFYSYHKANYDKGFKFIVNLCYDWTDGKWVPPFLQKLGDWMDNVSQLVTNTAIDGQTVAQPNKFSEFGKNNNFYKNISLFLVITLPLNLIAFIFFACLSRVAAEFVILKSLRPVLRPFRSFLSFWSSMFVDNMTYLSLLCFLQLYRFVPYSHGNQTLPSCVLCIVFFFLMLMTCFLGVPVRMFAANIFEIDYCK